ncbi:helix-turn-helix domain-containing protein [Novilysobacter spongiicola]|uniref:helix-turn-helix domain-containing protein n=1 Tax=Novilysobacter spongiicola TaxID=435289 RepID=UPI00099A37B9|nr:helix-turn-helix domain-containing protein [Lysobacter spongiicola]
MDRKSWADRGQLLQVDGDGGRAGSARCVAVTRLGSAQCSSSPSTIWVQLRGRTWVESAEGRFQLRRGDWIVLDRESCPLVQSDRRGVTLGLAIGGGLAAAAARLTETGLFAGRGGVDRDELRLFVRLWRGAERRLSDQVSLDGAGQLAALRPLLLFIGAMQREMAVHIARCPGRSHLRKRQVFSRLQRARLYIEGNCDRVVRIAELARLTSFSTWYFSRAFQSLYEESPQGASVRMRLERAALLLRTSGMLIGEIAAACGFDNCCSFARAFRSRFGTSASHYRRTALSGSPTHSAKPGGSNGKAPIVSGT